MAARIARQRDDVIVLTDDPGGDKPRPYSFTIIMLLPYYPNPQGLSRLKRIDYYSAGPGCGRLASRSKTLRNNGSQKQCVNDLFTN